MTCQPALPKRAAVVSRALPSTTPRRPRRRVLPAALALGLSLVLGLGAGSAMALWSASASTGALSLTGAAIGFSVQRGSSAPDVASGPNATVKFSLTSADATNVLATGGIAVPFTVAMMTSGGGGMNYAIAIGTPSAGSFLAAAQIDVFPQGGSGCQVGASPGSVDVDATTGQYIGVAPTATPRPVGTPASQAWCLTITYTPGSYFNGVAASGSHAAGGGPAVANPDSWSAVVGPDPAVQTTVNVVLTHTNTSLGDA